MKNKENKDHHWDTRKTEELVTGWENGNHKKGV